MEIVEHVEDVNYFINKSSEFLKKDGLMYVATLNKTLKSQFKEHKDNRALLMQDFAQWEAYGKTKFVSPMILEFANREIQWTSRVRNHRA